MISGTFVHVCMYLLVRSVVKHKKSKVVNPPRVKSWCVYTTLHNTHTHTDTRPCTHPVPTYVGGWPSELPTG